MTALSHSISKVVIVGFVIQAHINLIMSFILFNFQACYLIVYLFLVKFCDSTVALFASERLVSLFPF